MILQHDYFNAPINLDQKVWRYIDVTKLLDLINSNSLYFTQMDLFEDMYEGSLTKRTIEVRTNYYKELEQATEKVTDYTPEFWHKYNQGLKSEIALNCWHLNEHESAAMWKLYLKSNEGFAIQSTYNKLYNALDETEIPVFIGTVKYVDYESILSILGIYYCLLYINEKALNMKMNFAA